MSARLTEAGVKFLSDEQALPLQSIDGQRDAARHYLIDLSEHQLYFYAQAEVTLLRDIHDNVFDDESPRKWDSRRPNAVP